MSLFAPGDRVQFTLWPSDTPYTGTVVDMRNPVPRADPRIRQVTDEHHLIINDDRGGRAVVSLVNAQKLED